MNFIKTSPRMQFRLSSKRPHTPGHIAPQDLTPEPDNTESVEVLIEILPPWDCLLLQAIVFIKQEDEIWAALCKGTCFAASDRLAPKYRGSFAWVLSSTEGERLACCSRPVFGQAISSYRAEAYGMLSILWFFYQMACIFQKPGNKPQAPHLVCNNQGVIKTMTWIMEYCTISL